MRNIEERLERMHERAKQMEQNRQKKLIALTGTLSAILFAALIGVIRELAGPISDASGNAYTGSSLFSSDAGAYILIAVAFFMLGVVITVVIRRYLRKNGQEAPLAENPGGTGSGAVNADSTEDADRE